MEMNGAKPDFLSEPAGRTVPVIDRQIEKAEVLNRYLCFPETQDQTQNESAIGSVKRT